MKNVLLIGLGRFGSHIAKQLHSLGHEIMAVDVNEERVNKILPFVTNAQIETVQMQNFWNLLEWEIMIFVLLPSETAFRILWKRRLC